MIKLLFLICAMGSTCTKETSIHHITFPEKFKNVEFCVRQAQMEYAEVYYVNQEYQLKYNEYLKVECNPE